MSMGQSTGATAGSAVAAQAAVWPGRARRPRRGGSRGR